MLRDFIGAKFVQEVNAVSLAVEKLYPDAGSVIELGGQDAKIIIWFTDQETGNKRKVPSMNDKCAGGTGAVIDKINSKLQLSSEVSRAEDLRWAVPGVRSVRINPDVARGGISVSEHQCCPRCDLGCGADQLEVFGLQRV